MSMAHLIITLIGFHIAYAVLV